MRGRPQQIVTKRNVLSTLSASLSRYSAICCMTGPRNLNAVTIPVSSGWDAELEEETCIETCGRASLFGPGGGLG